MSEQETAGDYECESCGESIANIVELVKHGCSPVRLSARSLSRKERNTLMYIEVRVVDHGGRLDPDQMNHVDRQNIKVFTAAGLLEVSDFQRHPERPRKDIQQVESFSDAAWDLTRDCRQLRAYDDNRVDFPVGVDE